MPSSESLISRLIARMRALTHQDWRGEAGARFRETTKAISEFAEEHHVTPREVLDEGVELGRRKLEGMANHEFSEATRNFADAERVKIEAELQRRSMESDIRRKDADARKASADARMAELNAVAAEIDLLKKLQDAGVALHEDANGNLTALPLPQRVNLWQLANQRQLAAKGTPEVFRDQDGVHLTNECIGPISFPDETLIIESGSMVYGDVHGLNVEIRADAVVRGNIYASDTATLRAGSRLMGDVTTPRCSIEDGANFKGGIDIKK